MHTQLKHSHARCWQIQCWGHVPRAIELSSVNCCICSRSWLKRPDSADVQEILYILPVLQVLSDYLHEPVLHIFFHGRRRVGGRTIGCHITLALTLVADVQAALQPPVNGRRVLGHHLQPQEWVGNDASKEPILRTHMTCGGQLPKGALILEACRDFKESA